ncbi:Suppressor of fused [Portunus trituberculatus]|uniref:Suppressor of fused n=1 Tax=Portunus trituberculatus TaxID=210409 RepID=A0A5B7GLG7_PORTR|nr:Suppressor of fused [Portunus trituberculatus]
MGFRSRHDYWQVSRTIRYLFGRRFGSWLDPITDESREGFMFWLDPNTVSFGCSDLHGDGRVHEQTGPEGPSGFGFELTMRLKREEGEKSPPTWPAAIMQALAKYVFQSGL